MIGIDEAGKGPVIGPMVIAGIRSNSSNIPTEIADSKKLSKNKRERLYDSLHKNDNIRFSIIEVPSSEIDKNSNLNNLIVDKQAVLINELCCSDEEIFVDACLSDEHENENKLYNKTNAGNITATHGADEKYDIVSAASVIAKVYRDNRIDEINSKYNQDVGSGYPSDPTTRTFLEEYIEDYQKIPDEARESWNTITKIVKNIEDN